MRRTGIWGWLALISLVISCGAPKTLVSNRDLAMTAAEQANFEQSVLHWQEYISATETEKISGEDYALAAKSAYNAGKEELAANWFDQARFKEYSDYEMYAAMAEIYHSQNNLSKEMTALEYIDENYVDRSEQARERLFSIYHETKSYEKAKQLWGKLDESLQNDLDNQTKFFNVSKALKDSVACDSLSLVILEKDPDNFEALDWNAKKYYWLGENRYQEATEAYSNRQTTRGYKIMLEQLDIATADFKRSLKYLEKLWNKENKATYAVYFYNIYARFGDEKKSAYYKKLME